MASRARLLRPVFVIGYVLIYVFAIRAAWLPCRATKIATASAVFSSGWSCPASRWPWSSSAHRAHHAPSVAGGPQRRTTCAHARAKGWASFAGAAAPRAAQRRRPIFTVIASARVLIGGVVVTESVSWHPRGRPSHRGRRAGARLTPPCRRDLVFSVRLRADQPARRPVLHVLDRDPLLMARGPIRSVAAGRGHPRRLVASPPRPRAAHQRSERHRSRRGETAARRRAHGPGDDGRRAASALDGHRSLGGRLQPRRLRRARLARGG